MVDAVMCSDWWHDLISTRKWILDTCGNQLVLPSTSRQPFRAIASYVIKHVQKTEHALHCYIEWAWKMTRRDERYDKTRQDKTILLSTKQNNNHIAQYVDDVDDDDVTWKDCVTIADGSKNLHTRCAGNINVDRACVTTMLANCVCL